MPHPCHQREKSRGEVLRSKLVRGVLKRLHLALRPRDWAQKWSLPRSPSGWANCPAVPLSRLDGYILSLHLLGFLVLQILHRNHLGLPDQLWELRTLLLLSQLAGPSSVSRLSGRCQNLVRVLLRFSQAYVSICLLCFQWHKAHLKL